ncbi:cytochrome P450 [Zychaea mexicana]|uniref:cytochrome P450 n=1 Tax=Zychaea mexicana TaxID=64656 RepID=UPI0022FE2E4F|nr:cytochrome P450 [Zychaea mexicana]KAI9496863.1 cytochrome P450 [Zychaea mexicana]
MADMVNAGTDSTATSVAWAFVILSHFPDVQKQLRDEVDAFINKHGRLPTYEERENFPFLLSTQKECLRYKSLVHLVLHQVSEDIECKGYIIPRVSIVVSNTYTLHQDTTFYDNPEKFIPDRSMEDQTPMSVCANSREKRDQFTFGWGRRVCPGIHMAEVELFHIWVRVFATTIIEPPLDNSGKPVYPNLNAIEDLGIIVAPKESNLEFIERRDRLI